MLKRILTTSLAIVANGTLLAAERPPSAAPKPTSKPPAKVTFPTLTLPLRPGSMPGMMVDPAVSQARGLVPAMPSAIMVPSTTNPTNPTYIKPPSQQIAAPPTQTPPASVRTPVPALLPPPSTIPPALWPKPVPVGAPTVSPPKPLENPSLTPSAQSANSLKTPQIPTLSPPALPLQSDQSRNNVNPSASANAPVVPPIAPIAPLSEPIVPKLMPDPLTRGVPTPAPTVVPTLAPEPRTERVEPVAAQPNAPAPAIPSLAPRAPAAVVPPPMTKTPNATLLAPPTAVGQLTSLRLTPGESMMLPLSLRRTALAAVLGTALTTGQLLADEPMKPSADVATKADLKTIQETLDLLRKEIGELKSKDVGDIRKDLTDLKAKELADFRKELDSLREFKKQTQTTLEGGDKGSADGLVKKINSLDDKLTALEKQLTSIDSKLSETVRVALKSAVENEKKPAEKMGTIKIVNMYSTPIDVLINGKGYTVKSNESKDLPMAVGTFTYQLLTSGGEETKRAIKDGEVVTLLVK